MIQLAYIGADHKQKKRFIQPSTLAGESFGVHLKDGGGFYFKCTGYGEDFISGIDEEGTDLKIDINDIDMIVGVKLHESKRIE